MPLEAPWTMETPPSQLGKDDDDDDDVAKPDTLILLRAATNDGEISHVPPLFVRVFIVTIGYFLSDV